MKLNAFLTSLSKKTGLDLTKPEFKDVLASEIEIPDAMANQIETGLMNEEAAKANTRIRSAIKAEVYNGVDSDVLEILEKYVTDDNIKTSILSEKKTSGKIDKLVAHLEEQRVQASKDGDKTLVSALKKQVEDLNNENRTIKQTKQQEIDQLKADNENALVDYDLKGILNTKQYALPDAMKADEKVEMVYGIVKNELAAKGLKVIRENGKRVIQKLDGTAAFDDKSNPIEIDSLIDGALAQRGLLKVSDPAKPGNDPLNRVPGANPPNANHQQFISELDKEIASMVS